jgi:DNA-binding MarR family transcriptional regulator
VDERTTRNDRVELQQLARLLSQAEQALARRLMLALEQDGATVEQWRALTLLADGQSRTMSDIADLTLLPPASLTRLVDRMVSDNLVYRKADPADRRRILVRIAPRGRKMHERLRARMDDDDALATLTALHGTQLTAMLSAVVAHLRGPVV